MDKDLARLKASMDQGEFDLELRLENELMVARRYGNRAQADRCEELLGRVRARKAEDLRKSFGHFADGSFRFGLPLDLKKSKDGKVWFSGIASTEAPDLFGETVIQAGMDLGYFLKRGFVNWNHEKGPDAKIGVPTEASVTDKGLYVKGYFLDCPKAEAVIELGTSLAKSGSARRLGFSVEGKTLGREGKAITKSWIKDIAITAEPINPYTYMDIVKSISARLRGDADFAAIRAENEQLRRDNDFYRTIVRASIRPCAPR